MCPAWAGRNPDRPVQKRSRLRRQLSSQASPLRSPGIPTPTTKPAIPVHENDRGAVLAVSRAAIALGNGTGGNRSMRSGPTFAMRCSTGIRLKAQTGPTRARRGSALFFTISPPSGSGGGEGNTASCIERLERTLIAMLLSSDRDRAALRILHRMNGSSGKCGIRISQSRRTLRRAETAEAGIHKTCLPGRNGSPHRHLNKVKLLLP